MRIPHLKGRIRYVEDWNGRGEHFVFETRWSDEEEWGLATAYKLIDNMISYTALTTIREWERLGIKYEFV